MQHNLTRFTYYILLLWEIFKIAICNKIYHVFKGAAARYTLENSGLVVVLDQTDIET